MGRIDGSRGQVGVKIDNNIVIPKVRLNLCDHREENP